MRARRLLLGIAVLAACASSGPRPIAYDVDACAQCRMQISDRRFGGEVMTTKGRTTVFDAVECLREYYGGAERAGLVQSVWVIDFRRPGTFIDARSAAYVEVPGGKSPMGRGLLATETEAGARELQTAFGGTIKRWEELGQ